MRRGILLIAVILSLSSFGAVFFIGETEALEDGVSFMEMYATNDLYLTPKHVNETTMNFNRTDRWSQLPMVPWQWYRLGEWDSGSIETDYINSKPIEIMGLSTIWITLSCPEHITMDLSGAFCVNSNPAVDSVILEDVEVGPEPVKFTIMFDTDGYTHENFAHFSMRWNMRNGHDDVVIHVGEDHAGTSTYIEPLFVQEVWDLGEYGLSVEFINLFQEYEWALYLEGNDTGWEFDFKASVDGRPWEEVEDFYSMHGATDYHFITVPDFDGSPGEHLLRWEADYGINSHSSGSYPFTIEENQPEGDDDDEEPPVADDDDIEPPILTLTEEQCRRSYNDAVGDDLYFWDSNGEAGVLQGDHPNVDIRKVEVEKVGEDLVITISMSAVIDDDTLFDVYILPDDSHEQPPIDTDPLSSDDFPDYSPSNFVSTSDLMFFRNYWSCEIRTSGSTCTVKGSLQDLMSDGLTEDFQVFIAVNAVDLDLDIFSFGGIIISNTVDYAGSGAWKVENVEERSMDRGPDLNFSFLILPMIIIVIVIMVVVMGLVFFFISRKRKKVLS